MADQLPPDFPEEPKTAAELEEIQPDVQTPEEPSDEEHYIKIDKRQYGQEIQRLQREDPHFKEVFGAIVGQRAAWKYKPEIDQKARELEELRASIRREQFKQVPQEQLGQELARNPQLAAEYHQINQTQDPVVQQAIQMDQYVRGVLSDAMEAGLPDDEAQKLYDKAITTNFTNPQEYLSQFRKEVIGTTAKLLGETRQVVQQQIPDTQSAGTTIVGVSTNTPNQAVLTGAPVGSGTRNGVTRRYTKEQIDSLLAGDPAKFMKEFPDDGDFERAIASGAISGMGPNS